MWKIGQKVVCVDDVPRLISNNNLNTPKKDIIYTIREIYESKSQPGQLALVLNEIKNEIIPGLGRERGFHSWRFRLVDEEWAEDILNKIAEEIEEEALVWLIE